MLMEHELAWRRHAACAGQATDRWFPDDRTGAYRGHDAIEVCAGCPVRIACLEYALQHERAGIWGGLTETQRRRIRQNRDREGVAA